ncbi:MAG: redox-sensing transcriptional repressor Rex [Chloroflexota bacterium]
MLTQKPRVCIIPFVNFFTSAGWYRLGSAVNRVIERLGQLAREAEVAERSMKVARISEATVSRLPTYVACLAKLADEGVLIVSSHELSKSAGVSAAQLRKDLSYLGDFGVRGLGYEVKELLRQITRYLGLTRQWSIAIVGFGKLGSALANYPGFAEKNFRVVAVFDNDPKKIGGKVSDGELEIYPVEELDRVIKEKGVDLAIITTPVSAAQQVADRLVAAGVKSILKFAPLPLMVPDDVVIREVDLATEMQILSFYETLRGSQRPKD